MGIKLSVIVPVYNVEESICKCLDSIINQTYKNLEIILIDDGSTDNSGDICDRYASMDKRIKVFHGENKGLSYARNKGLEVCAGEWFTFVDSDDWLDLEMYENMCSVAGKESVDLVLASHICVEDNMDARTVGTGNMYLLTNSELLNEYITGKRKMFISPSVWDRIYKRKIFQNIRFVEGILYEDVSYTMRVFCECHMAAFIDKSFYRYCVERQGRIMEMDFTMRNWNDLLYTSKVAIDCLKEHGYDDYAEIEEMSFYNKVAMLYPNLKDTMVKKVAHEYLTKYRVEVAKKLYYSGIRGKQGVIYCMGIISPRIQKAILTFGKCLRSKFCLE